SLSGSAARLSQLEDEVTHDGVAQILEAPIHDALAIHGLTDLPRAARARLSDDDHEPSDRVGLGLDGQGAAGVGLVQCKAHQRHELGLVFSEAAYLSLQSSNPVSTAHAYAFVARRCIESGRDGLISVVNDPIDDLARTMAEALHALPPDAQEAYRYLYA